MAGPPSSSRKTKKKKKTPGPYVKLYMGRAINLTWMKCLGLDPNQDLNSKRTKVAEARKPSFDLQRVCVYHPEGETQAEIQERKRLALPSYFPPCLLDPSHHLFNFYFSFYHFIVHDSGYLTEAHDSNFPRLIL